jgi:hypothetical protein
MGTCVQIDCKIVVALVYNNIDCWCGLEYSLISRVTRSRVSYMALSYLFLSCQAKTKEDNASIFVTLKRMFCS